MRKCQATIMFSLNFSIFALFLSDLNTKKKVRKMTKNDFPNGTNYIQ